MTQTPARKRPTLPLTGGCFCGAIRYEITAFPLLVYACHCTQCQRQTGSAFGISMPVATGSLHIVKGTLKPWKRATATGNAVVTSWFCSGCGGRIYGERDTRPESINVRAGTLDDTSWLSPVAHFFMANAQPWEQISDPSICYDTFPPDVQSMTERWRALWSD